MAGQGHQFPGNFQANAAGMRSGFGAGPMTGQMQAMPNQLAGILYQNLIKHCLIESSIIKDLKTLSKIVRKVKIR